MKEKVAIFIDVQNIYYTCREFYGRQFNYQYFYNLIKTDDINLIIANCYAIDRKDDKQYQFQQTLRNIGYNVKLKPYITRIDGTSKGDWDVGITIDMLDKQTLEADRIILVCGDGDFDLLVDKLIVLGKEVDIFGVPKLTANSLKIAASNYYPITEKYLIK